MTFMLLGSLSSPSPSLSLPTSPLSPHIPPVHHFLPSLLPSLPLPRSK